LRGRFAASPDKCENDSDRNRVAGMGWEGRVISGQRGTGVDKCSEDDIGKRRAALAAAAERRLQSTTSLTNS
jgi:hypothetical protein